MVYSSATPINSSYEFSLSEIQTQLEQMGITDISTTALHNFQKDLQKMVHADSDVKPVFASNTTDFTRTIDQASTSKPAKIKEILMQKRPNLNNTGSDSEITLSQEYNLDSLTISNTVSASIGSNSSRSDYNSDNDDVVSITSTNQSNVSKSSKIVRKTMRNGVITSQIYENSDLSSLNTTISDYLEPELGLLKKKKKKNVEGSLYDEKIDDFVKALLAGDDTALDDESYSNFGEKNENIDLSHYPNLKKLNNYSKNCNKSGQKNINFNEINIEQLPPPPSFMRPSTAPPAGKRVNWHDPVKRHAEYEKYWKNQPRCNEAKDHKRTTKVKWQVRNELADLVRYNDEKFQKAREESKYAQYYNQQNSQNQNYGNGDAQILNLPDMKNLEILNNFYNNPTTHTNNSLHPYTHAGTSNTGLIRNNINTKSTKLNKDYIVPTEKKRNDIRWQIRNILHESAHL